MKRYVNDPEFIDELEKLVLNRFFANDESKLQLAKQLVSMWKEQILGEDDYESN